MNKPPNTTVIFKDIPPETSNWLVGIDTKFFSINQLLKGIKNIPRGLHYLHYSLPTVSTENSIEATQTSIRYGSWIDCQDDVIFLVWDPRIEKFHLVDENNNLESLNYSKYISSLGDIYNHTIEYPEDQTQWTTLINCLDMELVQEFLPYISMKYTDEINTVTPSREENMILLDQLQQKDSSRHYEDPKQEELKYTIIQFKKNRPNASVEEISADYLDKSWYIEELYGSDTDLLLGELQLSFLMFVIIGNFCSGLQWMNLLKLISMSKSFSDNKHFNLKFLKVFKAQLEQLPEEYVEDTVSLNSAVDTKNFIGILENFVRDIYHEKWNEDCCGKMKMNGMINQQWQSVKELIRNKFHIDLSTLQPSIDDDKFEVFDLKDYDENDEDSPAIA
ncbi:A1 cistron-splicing factor Aar2p [[Candida] jaroonii]|uniref:A1 cistron-splicing factor Aar2p n=1 Tax=[Candida] jaroonii TaxID=467808 RepID=A0ACA9Y214_9ASCO|nr:A1 cistron-splicing factor Aar2p [[Candida] jaroonii]